MDCVHNYLNRNDISLNRFAEMIGVNINTIRRPLLGQQSPSLRVALEIERKTGGAITGKAFLSDCFDAYKNEQTVEADTT